MPRQHVSIGLIVLLTCAPFMSTACGGSSTRAATSQAAVSATASQQASTTASPQSPARADDGRADIDIPALQAKVGSDPAAIARFVQTEIRYEPYSGALRGDRGTLRGRAGNSLDRALLVAAMLRAAGRKVRFAQGTLTAVQAEQLIRTAFPVHSPPLEFGGTSPLMTITRRAFSHFVYVGNALHDARIEAPSGDAGLWQQALDQARQHVWVQLLDGDRWVDIDPSPGVPFARALTTATTQMDAPDPKSFHTVGIRVEIETIHDGKRDRKTVLQSTARASDLAGVPVGLLHERRGETATPVLVTGDKRIAGEPFQTPLTIGLGDARAPLLNPFATGVDRVSAEWLTFDVSGPSGTRHAEYTIVDTEGAAARAAGAPPKAISQESVAATLEALDAVVGVGIATGFTPPAMISAMVADLRDPQSETGLIRALGLAASTYHAIRGLLPSSFLTPRALWYLDAPSIVVARAQLRPNPPTPMVVLDLTLKSYRTLRLPDDPLAVRGAFYDHLAAGILDHTAERWLLGSGMPGGSVGALFEAAAAQRIGVRVVATSESVPATILTADGRARISAAVDSGQIVLLPADRPTDWKSALGWWSLDPRTGRTEDTTEDGGHQDGAEYSGSVRGVAMPARQRLAILGCRVAAVVIAGVGAMELGGGLAGSYFGIPGPAVPVAIVGGAAGVAGGVALRAVCEGVGGTGGGAGPGGSPPAGPPGVGQPANAVPPNVNVPSGPSNTMNWGATQPGPGFGSTLPEGGEWPTLPGIADTIPGMPKIPW